MISYLASYARVNRYGFIEAPYRRTEKVLDDKGRCVAVKVTDQVDYMTADMEDEFNVAQATEPVDENSSPSARTATSESWQFLYSWPVATTGASVVSRGTACRCMLAPMCAISTTPTMAACAPSRPLKAPTSV